MGKRKIAITGAAGKVGSCVTEGLRRAGHYDVVAGDVHPIVSTGIIALDVTDPDQMMKFSTGVDTLIHCAWAPDEEDFLGKVLPVNVTAAYHLYEAARKNNLRRVIFASSNHATGFYKVGDDVEVTDPYRPDSFYGLSKCYIELLGRFYSDKYGISSINVRIGNFPGDDRPGSERSAHIWISERDMVQLMERCVEANDSMKFLCLYGTSANTDNYYDITYLEDLIGYIPQDDAADLLAHSENLQKKIPQDETAFQGGGYVELEPKQ